MALRCSTCGHEFGAGVDGEALRDHAAEHRPALPSIGLVVACDGLDGGPRVQSLDASEAGALLVALAGLLFPTNRTRRPAH